MNDPQTFTRGHAMDAILSSQAASQQKLVLLSYLRHQSWGSNPRQASSRPGGKALAAAGSCSADTALQWRRLLIDAGVLVCTESRPGRADAYRIDFDVLASYRAPKRLPSSGKRAKRRRESTPREIRPPRTAPPPESAPPGSRVTPPPESGGTPPPESAPRNRDQRNRDQRSREQDPPAPQGATPAAAASESGKPDDVSRIWDRWEPKRVEAYGGRTGTLTPARRRAMRARIRDHDAEAVETVIAWWLTSGHPRARYLRDQRFTWDTVLRPSNFPGYLEMATATAPGGGAESAEAGAEAAWRDLLRHLNDLGPAALDNAPDRIRSALREAGGYRRLADISNDFERNRFQARFVAAYQQQEAA